MLSQNSNGGGENGIYNSWRRDSTQVNSVAALANPLYSNFELERETTFCLKELQEIKLEPSNVQ